MFHCTECKGLKWKLNFFYFYGKSSLTLFFLFHRFENQSSVFLPSIYDNSIFTIYAFCLWKMLNLCWQTVPKTMSKWKWNFGMIILEYGTYNRWLSPCIFKVFVEDGNILPFWFKNKIVVFNLLKWPSLCKEFLK